MGCCSGHCYVELDNRAAIRLQIVSGMKRQLTIREMVHGNLIRMGEELRRNPDADQRLWQEQVEQLKRIADQLAEPELN